MLESLAQNGINPHCSASSLRRPSLLADDGDGLARRQVDSEARGAAVSSVDQPKYSSSTSGVTNNPNRPHTSRPDAGAALQHEQHGREQARRAEPIMIA